MKKIVSLVLLLMAISSPAQHDLSKFTAPSSGNLTEQSFSIAQLGDTQYLTNCLAQWTNTVDYLVAKKPSALFMPGDLADGAYDSEYVAQTNQLSRILAAGIPVFAVPGNHDPNRAQWEKFLTPLLLSQPNIAETFKAGQTYDGIVMTQNLGGLKLVYIGIGPFSYGSAPILAWLRDMGQKYQDRLALAVVHGYVDEGGGVMNPAETYYLGGDIYHTNFVTMPSLIQVLCGHVIVPSIFGPTQHHTSIGNSGNLFHGLLFNFQCAPPGVGGAIVGCGAHNCGVTWVRWYEWKPSANLISATTWENLGQTNRTTPDCQFSFPIRQSVLTRTSLASPAGQAILAANASWKSLTNNLELCVPITTASDAEALADLTGHHYSGVPQANSGGPRVTTFPDPSLWLTNNAMNGISALHLTGATNQVQYGNPNSFQGFTNLTLSAWVRTTASRYPAYIMAKHVTGTNGQFLIGMDSPTDVRFFVITTSGRVNLDGKSPAVNDGSWHLVCATYDGANEQAYFDGNLISTTPQTGAIATNTQAPFLLSGFVGGEGNGWDGELDDINVWSRALSASEIASLYNTHLSVADLLPSSTHAAGGAQNDPGSTNPVRSFIQYANAPSAAQIGGAVGVWTNHQLLNVNGALVDYWSDGEKSYSKQLAP